MVPSKNPLNIGHPTFSRCKVTDSIFLKLKLFVALIFIVFSKIPLEFGIIAHVGKVISILFQVFNISNSPSSSRSRSYHVDEIVMFSSSGSDA